MSGLRLLFGAASLLLGSAVRIRGSPQASNRSRPVASSCPKGLVKLGVDALQRDIAEGPVNAPPDYSRVGSSRPSQPHYVFITGAAYTGTTALYGLMSTSPAASNLCQAHETCCEGGPLLMHWQQIPWNQPTNPEYPHDWKAALEVYRKFWDTSKPVLIEKTIENAERFPHIWESLKNSGSKVSFVYLVRSKCFFKMQYVQKWKAVTKSMVETARKLRNAGARLHVVRYEELLSDPYGVARSMLRFLPELLTLNPARTGLSGAPMLGNGHERSLPIVDYLKYHNYRVEFPHPQGFDLAYTDEESEWMNELGYTRQWFERFPVIKSD